MRREVEPAAEVGSRIGGCLRKRLPGVKPLPCAAASDRLRYRGTRLDGEKDYYEEYFGGDPRTQNVIISAEDGTSAVTSVGLDAMLEVGERGGGVRRA